MGHSSRHAGDTEAKCSRWLTFLRFYLTQMMKLCRFNPADERRGFGPSARRDQLPVWSHALLIFYAYFTVKLLVSVALQHQYNRLIQDLATGPEASGDESTGNAAPRAGEGEQNSAARPGANQTSSSTRAQQQQQERAQLEITINRLRLVGNAYYEFGAPIEPLYLLLAYIFYLTYLQALIYTNLRRPVTVDLLRAIFDPERHRSRVMLPEIERLASRYIGSSANYLLTRLAGAWPDEDKDELRRQTVDRSPFILGPEGHHFLRKGPLCALERAHEHEVRQVAELLANDELVPPNRRPEQIERLARLHGASIVLINILSTGFAMLVFIVLPRLRLNSIQVHDEPRDLLFQAELFCYCVVLIQCYIFVMTTVIVTVLDHIAFVTVLERVTLDSAAAARLDDAADTSRNLIRLIILYELLKRQLKCEQGDMRFVSANILILILTTPVLARLYVAQMAPGYRYIYLACSMLVILGCDLVLLPFCRLHARCLDMLRARSRLLASIDARLLEVRRQKWPASSSPSSSSPLSSLSLWAASHDEHTVRLLRRDQQVPELAVRTFALDAFFLRVTYVNLLGVHFWCALLLAPMCMRNTLPPLGDSGNLLTLIF